MTANYVKETLISAQSRMKDMYDFYNSKIPTQIAKIDYLLESKQSEFDAKIEAKLNSYGCSDSEMKSYLENMNFTELHKCIGAFELASLEAVDEMF